MKRTLVIATILCAGLAGALALAPGQARAVTPISDSYNNKMIDDALFINAGTMQASDIQAFLASKVPSCANGYCLKNYSEGGKSAAQIIYEASTQAGMNPQVILATLQKEQSLITNPAPSQAAVNFAMGYGCPEGPGCNPAYNGFRNQLTLGAKLLRAGIARNCDDTWTWSNIWINPKWHVGHSPTVDGRATYLANCATGSLYNYTPHRPDSAWRGATNGTLYYGNYNFVKNFTAWFGSTTAPTWHAQYLGQSNAPHVIKGQSVLVSATYRNTGTATWHQNKVYLGTDRPRDRHSGFSTHSSGWASPTRVAMQESSVAPGQDAHFVFEMTGNPDLGFYKEYFRPVAEGVTWMEDVGLSFSQYVVGGSYYAKVTEFHGPDLLDANRQGDVTVRVRNLGSSTWTRNGSYPMRLGTQNATNHDSALHTAGSWLTENRIPMQEASVPPFGTATFKFKVTAPGIGRYTEHLAPVAEAMTWLNAPIDFTVETRGTYNAQPAGQSPYPRLLPGQTSQYYIDFKNTGTTNWYNSGRGVVRLGTDNPRDRHAPSAHSSWITPSRPATFSGKVSGGNVTAANVIAPGETARFQFTIKGPPSGFYREYFRPVSEGRTWFGPANHVSYDVNTAPRYGAQWVGQSAPAPVSGTGQQTAWIEFRNTGNLTWYRDGSSPLRLGTDRPRDRASALAGTSGWISPSRIRLDQASVAPGQVGRFTFTFKANGKPPGTYREYLRPVAEGVTWLEDWGVNLPVRVE